MSGKGITERNIAGAILALRLPRKPYVSRYAIRMWLGDIVNNKHLNNSIRDMIRKGYLIQRGDSFKLSYPNIRDKPCESGKIRNRDTGRCVKRNTRLGKVISHSQHHHGYIGCGNGKVLNYASGRCVDINGKLGKTVVENAKYHRSKPEWYRKLDY